jgi:hypothetical protein
LIDVRKETSKQDKQSAICTDSGEGPRPTLRPHPPTTDMHHQCPAQSRTQGGEGPHGRLGSRRPEKARMRAGAVRRRSATCQSMESAASALLRTDVVFFAEAAPSLSLVAGWAKVNRLTATVRPRSRSHALRGFWFIFSLNVLGEIMGGI